MGLFSVLKSDKPRFKKLKEEGCVLTLSVDVPAQELEDQSQTALVRLQHGARIPGFRPGKAPLDVVKQHFSDRAREEALDALIRKHVPVALAELKLRVVDAPVIEDVRCKPGENVILSVRVEVAPTPTAKDYVKILVARKPRSADEGSLAKRIEELREAHARLEAAPEEAVGPGHIVVVDYAGFRGGKPIPGAKGASELVDMNAEQSVEGLTQGLLGLKRGDSKTLAVKLAERDAELLVTVKEIKVKLLPALDDELAKDLGFETVSELQIKLKEVLDRETAAQSEADAARQIEEALVKANPFPLPPSMVERQLEGMIERLRRQLMGPAKLNEKALADLKAKLQPRAEDEVRLAFVLGAIADREKIEVGETELGAELEAGLRDARDETKKKELYQAFERRKEQIAHMMRERKTMAFLKEKAVYKDV